MTTRFLQEEYENFFEFLDELRESGVTNMFGAGPYVRDRFDLNRAQAKQVVVAWMETFRPGVSPTERAKIAYEKTLPIAG